ncbi:DUF6456 domain-containing protein [Devosia geojensis]|nr:DUF6456 domain-containing protein [Devosia geojensis]
MARSELIARRFVRTLLPNFRAVRKADGSYEVERADRSVRLDAGEAGRLVDIGVLVVEGEVLRATGGARAWLDSKRPATEPVLARHADMTAMPDGRLKDLGESPLARLALAVNGQDPFLAPHHVEAGERIRRLAGRAQMIQRTTMSYDPARAASTKGARGGGGDIAESALDARRRIGDLLDALPRDCAGVVLDVCGLLKGLQTVEAERGWPRRSAKLVLRIGLDQLAARLGLDPEARGRERGRVQGWLDARPTRFE